MAADIAREIIAQSRGGGKLGFSFSIVRTSGSARSDNDNVILSTAYDADKNAIYHVRFTNDGNTSFELTYSDVDAALDAVESVIRSKRSLFETMVNMKVVLTNNNTPLFSLPTLNMNQHDGMSFSALVKSKLNIIDVIDVVEN